MTPANGVVVRAVSGVVRECRRWGDLAWRLVSQDVRAAGALLEPGFLQLMFDSAVCQVTSGSLEVKSRMELTKGRSHMKGWGEVPNQQAKQTNDE